MKIQLVNGRTKAIHMLTSCFLLDPFKINFWMGTTCWGGRGVNESESHRLMTSGLPSLQVSVQTKCDKWAESHKYSSSSLLWESFEKKVGFKSTRINILILFSILLGLIWWTLLNSDRWETCSAGHEECFCPSYT